MPSASRRPSDGPAARSYARAFIIRRLYERGGISQAALARRFQLHPSSIWEILQRRTYRTASPREEAEALSALAAFLREEREEEERKERENAR